MNGNGRGGVSGVGLGDAFRLGLLLLRRRFRLFLRIAQHVAAAPDGLDIIVATGRRRQLLAQLAHEDIDDLEFRLVHAAVEMIEEHLLGQRRALAQRQELSSANARTYATRMWRERL